MPKVIVITGPTGVGKTKASVELAKKLNGEIINADAMQVYKGLNIGTAKIKESEKDNIPHHLLDIKNIDEEYTIYHYQKDARNKIDEILKRNHTPILVGGTGLYIKSALYDYKLNDSKKDLTKYENQTTEELYNELIQKDARAITKIDKNNRRRIINALDYYEKENKSITENRTDKLLYDVIIIGLTTNRENLYQIINNRVDEMIKDGLIEEVKKYYTKEKYLKPLMNGIGYKEIIKYLDGSCSKEEAIEEIKKNSRHYAKRQYTFFNHQLKVNWIETNYQDFNKTIKEIETVIDKEMNN